MLIRILSAISGLPLLVYIVLTGGKVLLVSVMVVTLIALKEFYDIFDRTEIYPFKLTGTVTGTAIVFVSGIHGEQSYMFTLMLIIACTIVCFITMVAQKSFRIVDLAITLFGVIYISVFISVILMIYNLKHGPDLLWLVFIIAWLGDTVAYFSGLTFGRHKLSPAISPKKSIEGSIGGLVGSTAGAVLFGLLMHRWSGINFSPAAYTLVGVVGGLMSQLGDLSASIIKRFAGVKDFGNIIPGHGGILDRFDSILFTAPVVYIYIKYFF